MTGAPQLLLPPRATFGHVARSEWTKFRTVRATFWCLLLATVLGIGLVALVAFLGASRYQSDPEVHFGWNPVTRPVRVLLISQLVFAVFGVITVTAEYSSGMIRTSLAAVPRRGRLMVAKLVVFAVASVVAGQVISFVAFAIAQALIHGMAPSASFGQHLVVRVVVGAGLYLALLGLLGMGLGFLLRNAAAGIGVLVALLFVLPLIFLLFPTGTQHTLNEYWPTEAGQQVYALHAGSHELTAWLGFGWMALFTALVLGAAFAVLRARDA